MPNKAVKKVEIASEDAVVDLKSKDRHSPSFKVTKIEDDQSEQFQNMDLSKFDDLDPVMHSLAERLSKSINAAPAKETQALPEPKEQVKVKFAKFVQLVASRDFFGVMERNKDEDIIMSSNLLTELAGAVDQKGEKKTPVIFLVGLAIGVVITYILISH